MKLKNLKLIASAVVDEGSKSRENSESFTVLHVFVLTLHSSKLRVPVILSLYKNATKIFMLALL